MDYTEVITELVTKPIDAYIDAITKLKEDIELCRKELPTTVQEFNDYFQRIEDLKARVDSLDFQISDTNYIQAAFGQIAGIKEQFLVEQGETINQYISDYEKELDRLKEEAVMHNRSLYNEVLANNSVFTTIAKKQEALLQHSSEITELCRRYGVTSESAKADMT